MIICFMHHRVTCTVFVKYYPSTVLDYFLHNQVRDHKVQMVPQPNNPAGRQHRENLIMITTIQANGVGNLEIQQ